MTARTTPARLDEIEAKLETLERMESRLRDIEGAIASRLEGFRFEQRLIAREGRLGDLARRADPAEIRALSVYDRRQVLSMVDRVDQWALSLEDPFEFFDDLPPNAQNRVEVAECPDLEPCVEIGKIPRNVTHRPTDHEITAAQYDALKDAGLGSLIRQVHGVYAMHGIDLDVPRTYPRAQYDALLDVDSHLRGYVQSGMVKVRDLTRDELEARTLASLAPRYAREPLTRRRTTSKKAK